MLTVLLGVAVVAGMGAASAAWIATSHRTARWREQRRRVRDWRRSLRYLHSGHVDDLPRTGGPPDSGDAP